MHSIINRDKIYLISIFKSASIIISHGMFSSFSCKNYHNHHLPTPIEIKFIAMSLSEIS